MNRIFSVLSLVVLAMLTTGGNVLIRNATILTGTGRTLPGHSLLVRNGKIVAIAAGLTVEDAVLHANDVGAHLIAAVHDAKRRRVDVLGCDTHTSEICWSEAMESRRMDN